MGRLGMINPFLLLKTVEQYFFLPEGSITALRRSRRNVAARDIAIWLLRQEGYSLSEIGAIILREHTTVLHSVNKTQRNMQNGNNAAIIRDIQGQLGVKNEELS